MVVSFRCPLQPHQPTGRVRIGPRDTTSIAVGRKLAVMRGIRPGVVAVVGTGGSWDREVVVSSRGCCLVGGRPGTGRVGGETRTVRVVGIVSGVGVGVGVGGGMGGMGGMGGVGEVGGVDVRGGMGRVGGVGGVNVRGGVDVIGGMSRVRERDRVCGVGGRGDASVWYHCGCRAFVGIIVRHYGDATPWCIFMPKCNQIPK
jgi:hypothetical protein